MNKLIFLSSPYTHQDKSVELTRYLLAIEIVAKIMNRGEFIFSPIVHCHEAAVQFGLPTDWIYWKDYCELIIAKCDVIYVLAIDGYLESNGVNAEIEIGIKLGIPIVYIDMEGIIITT